MKVPFLGIALSMAAAFGVAGDLKPEKQRLEPAQPVLHLPEALPPVASRGTVGARLTPEASTQRTRKDELDGLRAVALREGLAEVTFGGVPQKLAAGDLLGTGIVKAIGSDRIVLDRPFAVPGGAPGRALVIVTFGPGGAPRVRAYVDVGALPPPPPFEEAH